MYTPVLPLSLTYPVLEEDEDEAEGAMQGPEYTELDRRHMRRALELAAKALGAWVGREGKGREGGA
jgi:hypothetical protein